MAEAEKLCAICQTPLAESDEVVPCPDCAAPYHSECWQDNGGCGVYGCAQVPKTENRSSLEIPVSYWGQENKICPVCQAQILAAAVRCRNCGTTFNSARPQDSAEFSQRAQLSARAPALRKKIGWLFAFCVLPCTSPIATIIGTIWYSARRREIAALPALYPALSKIALLVGYGQIFIAIIVSIALALRRH